MPSQESDILVLGAGVIGLTTAYVLTEAGLKVQIYSKDSYVQSTSAVAGALWYPSKLEPELMVRSWAIHSLKRFETLSQDLETGVSIKQITRFFHRRMNKPWWAEHVQDFQLLYPEDCHNAKCGYEFYAPLIDMPRYLGWLTGLLTEKGVRFQIKNLESLNSICKSFSWVLNCTGIGARDLVNDLQLIPVRGLSLIYPRQSSTIELPDTALMEWDHPQGPIYYVPRHDTSVVGGSEELEPFPSLEASAKSIAERARIRFPDLGKLEPLRVEVGYRPKRPHVRVEPDHLISNLIHHYGHSGNGVTLSWGSAREILKLIQAQ